MALVQNFSITDNGETLTFKELTAAYSVSNTGGWGAPNPVVGDATSITLSVGVPGNTDLVVIDISDTFPTTDITDEFEITTTLLGIDCMVGGVYKFILTTVVGVTTYTTTKYYWIDKNVECWFDKKLFGMNINKLQDLGAFSHQAYQSQFTDEFESISKLYMLFQIAERAAQNNNVTYAQCIMDFINSKTVCC